MTGRGRLLQVLGVPFGVAVLVGNTILIGILRTPGDVAARLPHPALFIGVWVLGGCYALLGAISLAEPGAMVARSGGQYPFVRRGLGEYPGIRGGLERLDLDLRPGRARRDGLHEYLEPLVPALAGRRVPAGVALVLLFGLLLWRGIRVGDLSQQILSALEGAGVRHPDRGLPASVPVTGRGRRCRPRRCPRASALITAVVLALQAVIYTYDGWTGPLYFGEEVRDPGRGIPRSMVAGVLLVILIYVLVNLAFVRVLGMEPDGGRPVRGRQRGQGAVRRAGRPGDPAAGAGLHSERHERVRAHGAAGPSTP